ncbi:hypothetical protein TGP89_212810 [Toxoplasma gondii p89]|uniref:Uncharacterized protein n=1 Tax=Toxoplasma gondii p89 TaxID=943119 RepID=A0A086KIB0_TOXGO|nr:hypothetical protein TGP89_212810 [Toxoplasma gondii p89]
MVYVSANCASPFASPRGTRPKLVEVTRIGIPPGCHSAPVTLLQNALAPSRFVSSWQREEEGKRPERGRQEKREKRKSPVACGYSASGDKAILRERQSPFLCDSSRQKRKSNVETPRYKPLHRMHSSTVSSSSWTSSASFSTSASSSSSSSPLCRRENPKRLSPPCKRAVPSSMSVPCREREEASLRLHSSVKKVESERIRFRQGSDSCSVREAIEIFCGERPQWSVRQDALVFVPGAPAKPGFRLSGEKSVEDEGDRREKQTASLVPQTPGMAGLGLRDQLDPPAPSNTPYMPRRQTSNEAAEDSRSPASTTGAERRTLVGFTEELSPSVGATDSPFFRKSNAMSLSSAVSSFSPCHRAMPSSCAVDPSSQGLPISPACSPSSIPGPDELIGASSLPQNVCSPSLFSLHRLRGRDFPFSPASSYASASPSFRPSPHVSFSRSPPKIHFLPSSDRSRDSSMLPAFLCQKSSSVALLHPADSPPSAASSSWGSRSSCVKPLQSSSPCRKSQLPSSTPARVSSCFSSLPSPPPRTSSSCQQSNCGSPGSCPSSSSFCPRFSVAAHCTACLETSSLPPTNRSSRLNAASTREENKVSSPSSSPPWRASAASHVSCPSPVSSSVSASIFSVGRQEKRRDPSAVCSTPQPRKFSAREGEAGRDGPQAREGGRPERARSKEEHGSERKQEAEPRENCRKGEMAYETSTGSLPSIPDERAATPTTLTDKKGIQVDSETNNGLASPASHAAYIWRAQSQSSSGNGSLSSFLSSPSSSFSSASPSLFSPLCGPASDATRLAGLIAGPCTLREAQRALTTPAKRFGLLAPVTKTVSPSRLASLRQARGPEKKTKKTKDAELETRHTEQAYRLKSSREETRVKPLNAASLLGNEGKEKMNLSPCSRFFSRARAREKEQRSHEGENEIGGNEEIRVAGNDEPKRQEGGSKGEAVLMDRIKSPESDADRERKIKLEEALSPCSLFFARARRRLAASKGTQNAAGGEQTCGENATEARQTKALDRTRRRTKETSNARQSPTKRRGSFRLNLHNLQHLPCSPSAPFYAPCSSNSPSFASSSSSVSSSSPVSSSVVSSSSFPPSFSSSSAASSPFASCSYISFSSSSCTSFMAGSSSLHYGFWGERPLRGAPVEQPGSCAARARHTRGKSPPHQSFCFESPGLSLPLQRPSSPPSSRPSRSLTAPLSPFSDFFSRVQGRTATLAAIQEQPACCGSPGASPSPLSFSSSPASLLTFESPQRKNKETALSPGKKKTIATSPPRSLPIQKEGRRDPEDRTAREEEQSRYAKSHLEALFAGKRQAHIAGEQREENNETEQARAEREESEENGEESKKRKEETSHGGDKRKGRTGEEQGEREKEEESRETEGTHADAREGNMMQVERNAKDRGAENGRVDHEERQTGGEQIGRKKEYKVGSRKGNGADVRREEEDSKERESRDEACKRPGACWPDAEEGQGAERTRVGREREEKQELQSPSRSSKLEKVAFVPGRDLHAEDPREERTDLKGSVEAEIQRGRTEELQKGEARRHPGSDGRKRFCTEGAGTVGSWCERQIGNSVRPGDKDTPQKQQATAGEDGEGTGKDNTPSKTRHFFDDQVAPTSTALDRSSQAAEGKGTLVREEEAGNSTVLCAKKHGRENLQIREKEVAGSPEGELDEAIQRVDLDGQSNNGDCLRAPQRAEENSHSSPRCSRSSELHGEAGAPARIREETNAEVRQGDTREERLPQEAVVFETQKQGQIPRQKQEREAREREGDDASCHASAPVHPRPQAEPDEDWKQILEELEGYFHSLADPHSPSQIDGSRVASCLFPSSLPCAPLSPVLLPSALPFCPSSGVSQGAKGREEGNKECSQSWTCAVLPHDPQKDGQQSGDCSEAAKGVPCFTVSPLLSPARAPPLHSRGSQQSVLKTGATPATDFLPESVEPSSSFRSSSSSPSLSCVSSSSSRASSSASSPPVTSATNAPDCLPGTRRRGLPPVPPPSCGGTAQLKVTLASRLPSRPPLCSFFAVGSGSVSRPLSTACPSSFSSSCSSPSSSPVLCSSPSRSFSSVAGCRSPPPRHIVPQRNRVQSSALRVSPDRPCSLLPALEAEQQPPNACGESYAPVIPSLPSSSSPFSSSSSPFSSAAAPGGVLLAHANSSDAKTSPASSSSPSVSQVDSLPERGPQALASTSPRRRLSPSTAQSGCPVPTPDLSPVSLLTSPSVCSASSSSLSLGSAVPSITSSLSQPSSSRLPLPPRNAPAMPTNNCWRVSPCPLPHPAIASPSRVSSHSSWPPPASRPRLEAVQSSMSHAAALASSSSSSACLLEASRSSSSSYAANGTPSSASSSFSSSSSLTFSSCSASSASSASSSVSSSSFAFSSCSASSASSASSSVSSASHACSSSSPSCASSSSTVSSVATSSTSVSSLPAPASICSVSEVPQVSSSSCSFLSASCSAPSLCHTRLPSFILLNSAYGCFSHFLPLPAQESFSCPLRCSASHSTHCHSSTLSSQPIPLPPLSPPLPLASPQCQGACSQGLLTFVPPFFSACKTVRTCPFSSSFSGTLRSPSCSCFPSLSSYPSSTQRRPSSAPHCSKGSSSRRCVSELGFASCSHLSPSASGSLVEPKLSVSPPLPLSGPASVSASDLAPSRPSGLYSSAVAPPLSHRSSFSSPSSYSPPRCPPSESCSLSSPVLHSALRSPHSSSSSSSPSSSPPRYALSCPSLSSRASPVSSTASSPSPPRCPLSSTPSKSPSPSRLEPVLPFLSPCRSYSSLFHPSSSHCRPATPGNSSPPLGALASPHLPFFPSASAVAVVPSSSPHPARSSPQSSSSLPRCPPPSPVADFPFSVSSLASTGCSPSGLASSVSASILFRPPLLSSDHSSSSSSPPHYASSSWLNFPSLHGLSPSRHSSPRSSFAQSNPAPAKPPPFPDGSQPSSGNSNVSGRPAAPSPAPPHFRLFLPSCRDLRRRSRLLSSASSSPGPHLPPSPDSLSSLTPSSLCRCTPPPPPLPDCSSSPTIASSLLLSSPSRKAALSHCIPSSPLAAVASPESPLSLAERDETHQRVSSVSIPPSWTGAPSASCRPSTSRSYSVHLRQPGSCERTHKTANMSCPSLHVSQPPLFSSLPPCALPFLSTSPTGFEDSKKEAEKLSTKRNSSVRKMFDHKLRCDERDGEDDRTQGRRETEGSEEGNGGSRSEAADRRERQTGREESWAEGKRRGHRERTGGMHTREKSADAESFPEKRRREETRKEVEQKLGCRRPVNKTKRGAEAKSLTLKASAERSHRASTFLHSPRHRSLDRVSLGSTLEAAVLHHLRCEESELEVRPRPSSRFPRCVPSTSSPCLSIKPETELCRGTWGHGAPERRLEEAETEGERWREVERTWRAQGKGRQRKEDGSKGTHGLASQVLLRGEQENDPDKQRRRRKKTQTESFREKSEVYSKGVVDERPERVLAASLSCLHPYVFISETMEVPNKKAIQNMTNRVRGFRLQKAQREKLVESNGLNTHPFGLTLPALRSRSRERTGEATCLETQEVKEEWREAEREDRSRSDQVNQENGKGEKTESFDELSKKGAGKLPEGWPQRNASKNTQERAVRRPRQQQNKAESSHSSSDSSLRPSALDRSRDASPGNSFAVSFLSPSHHEALQSPPRPTASPASHCSADPCTYLAFSSPKELSVVERTGPQEKPGNRSPPCSHFSSEASSRRSSSLSSLWKAHGGVSPPPQQVTVPQCGKDTKEKGFVASPSPSALWSPAEELLALFFSSPPESRGSLTLEEKRSAQPKRLRSPRQSEKKTQSSKFVWASQNEVTGETTDRERKRMPEEKDEGRSRESQRHKEKQVTEEEKQRSRKQAEKREGTVFDRLFNSHKFPLARPSSFREKRKQQRREEERDRRLKEAAECTFRPNISRSQRTVSGLRLRSSDEALGGAPSRREGTEGFEGRKHREDETATKEKQTGMWRQQRDLEKKEEAGEKANSSGTAENANDSVNDSEASGGLEQKRENEFGEERRSDTRRQREHRQQREVRRRDDGSGERRKQGQHAEEKGGERQRYRVEDVVETNILGCRKVEGKAKQGRHSREDDDERRAERRQQGRVREKTLRLWLQVNADRCGENVEKKPQGRNDEDDLDAAEESRMVHATAQSQKHSTESDGEGLLRDETRSEKDWKSRNRIQNPGQEAAERRGRGRSKEERGQRNQGTEGAQELHRIGRPGEEEGNRRETDAKKANTTKQTEGRKPMKEEKRQLNEEEANKKEKEDLEKERQEGQEQDANKEVGTLTLCRRLPFSSSPSSMPSGPAEACQQEAEQMTEKAGIPSREEVQNRLLMESERRERTQQENNTHQEEQRCATGSHEMSASPQREENSNCIGRKTRGNYDPFLASKRCQRDSSPSFLKCLRGAKTNISSSCCSSFPRPQCSRSGSAGLVADHHSGSSSASSLRSSPSSRDTLRCVYHHGSSLPSAIPPSHSSFPRPETLHTQKRFETPSPLSSFLGRASERTDTLEGVSRLAPEPREHREKPREVVRPPNHSPNGHRTSAGPSFSPSLRTQAQAPGRKRNGKEEQEKRGRTWLRLPDMKGHARRERALLSSQRGSMKRTFPSAAKAEETEQFERTDGLTAIDFQELNGTCQTASFPCSSRSARPDIDHGSCVSREEESGEKNLTKAQGDKRKPCRMPILRARAMSCDSPLLLSSCRIPTGDSRVQVAREEHTERADEAEKAGPEDGRKNPRQRPRAQSCVGRICFSKSSAHFQMAGDFGSTWKQKTSHSSQQRDTKRETREGLLQQTGVSKGRTNLSFLRQLGPADTGRRNTERNTCRGVPLTHSNCKKLDLFPFKPQVFKPRRSSEPSASVLSLLRNPVTARLYCAQLARMERCAEEKRRLIKELRQLEELKECTFKPKLISTPLRFIARKALRRSAYPTDASSSYGSDKWPSVALQAPDALAGMLVRLEPSSSSASTAFPPLSSRSLGPSCTTCSAAASAFPDYRAPPFFPFSFPWLPSGISPSFPPSCSSPSVSVPSSLSPSPFNYSPALGAFTVSSPDPVSFSRPFPKQEAETAGEIPRTQRIESSRKSKPGASARHPQDVPVVASPCMASVPLSSCGEEQHTTKEKNQS